MLNISTFRYSLEKICPDYQSQKFLLGVSGGVDSMALLHCFVQLSLVAEVAHVNYGLRQNSSIADQQLVERTCEEYKIPLHLKIISDDQRKQKGSIQEWARDLRYDWFRQLQNERQLQFLVTAHHLNDQLETFLIHLSKAAGMNGLSGIPANKNRILRPLLTYSKQEIYDFADHESIEFREDESNAKNLYVRNHIRNLIIPELSKLNKDFLPNFGKSISYINETRDFVEKEIGKIEETLLTSKNTITEIKKKLFFEYTNFIQFEILRKFGFDNRTEILKMQNGQTGKIFRSKTHELLIDRETLIIKERKVSSPENIEIPLEINSDRQLLFPDGLFNEQPQHDEIQWQIDVETVRLPLKIRHKKNGDEILPIGMIGKKKISKFFKDEKIPILAQQKIWLLCDADDQVLGILPFRQDRRFAANSKTTNSIIIKL